MSAEMDGVPAAAAAAESPVAVASSELDAPPSDAVPAASDAVDSTRRKSTVDEQEWRDAIPTLDSDGDGKIDAPDTIAHRVWSTAKDVNYTLISNLKGTVEGGPFQTVIIGFICLAAVIAGCQTYHLCDGEAYVYSPQTLNICLTPWFVTTLDVLDWIILAVFIMEAAAKCLAEAPYYFRYFFELDTRCIEVLWDGVTPVAETKRGRAVQYVRAFTGSWLIINTWNCFDFFIVVISCYRPDPNAEGGGAEVAVVFKILRLLRIFKLFKAIPQLQMLVVGMVKAMNYGLYIGLLIGLITYIYAILGVLLWKSNDPVMFGTLHDGIVTLVQAMSGDDWTELFYTNLYGCDHGLQDGHYGQLGPGERCVLPEGSGAVLGMMPSLYFVTFHFVAGLLLMNLFIGAIMMALEESKEEMADGEELIVTVVRCRDLEVADWSILGEAFSDPYCMLEMRAEWPPEKPKYKCLRPDKKADAYKYTKGKKQNLNPEFDETFSFKPLESFDSSILCIQVYDWDRCGDDDPLGDLHVDVDKLECVVGLCAVRCQHALHRCAITGVAHCPLFLPCSRPPSLAPAQARRKLRPEPSSPEHGDRPHSVDCQEGPILR